MIAAFKTDAFSEFKYDPRIGKSGGFRIVTGSGKGQVISKQAFNARLAAYIQQQQQGLVGLADRLPSGDINLAEFQKLAARYLSELHTSTVLSFGIQNLQKSDWQLVHQILLDNLYSGKDEVTGQRYGLQELSRQIKAGDVSPAQLKHRLTLFSLSAKQSYHAVDLAIKQRNGATWAKRVLTPGDNCPQCIEYSGKWKPIDEIQPLCQGCDCGVRCRCSIETSKTIPDSEKRKQELAAIESKGFGKRKR